MKRIWVFQGSLLGVLVGSMSGCATELPSLVNPDQVTGSLVVGRVLTVLTGETSRRYPPGVRFFELEEQTSQKRFQVEVKSRDQYFAVDLSPAEYRLNRVQISEGPFVSMDDVSMAFSVDAGAITYVGTWRFEVDSSRYGRMVGARDVVTLYNVSAEFAHSLDGRSLPDIRTDCSDRPRARRRG